MRLIRKPYILFLSASFYLILIRIECFQSFFTTISYKKPFHPLHPVSSSSASSTSSPSLFTPPSSSSSFKNNHQKNLFQLFALKNGVREKIEEIRLQFYELLENHPEIAEEVNRSMTEPDFSDLDEISDNNNTGLFEDLPDKIEEHQPPIIKAKVMKSVLDSDIALQEIEEDLRLCAERSNDKEQQTREIAFNFEQDLMEIKMSIEEELNKLVEK